VFVQITLFNDDDLTQYLYQMGEGKDRMGSKQKREKERQREKIYGVRDGALERFVNGLCHKTDH
jgi:hypothetical protein